MDYQHLRSLSNEWRAVAAGVPTDYGAPDRRPDGVVTSLGLTAAQTLLHAAWPELTAASRASDRGRDPILLGKLTPVDAAFGTPPVFVSVEKHVEQHWIVFSNDTPIWLGVTDELDPGWWSRDPAPYTWSQRIWKSEITVSLGVRLLEQPDASLLGTVGAVVWGESAALYAHHRWLREPSYRSPQGDLWPVDRRRPLVPTA